MTGSFAVKVVLDKMLFVSLDYCLEHEKENKTSSASARCRVKIKFYVLNNMLLRWQNGLVDFFPHFAKTLSNSFVYSKI